jgi:hypothetical protein
MSEPLFDLFSFARRGPGRRDRLSAAQIGQVARTIGRAPEVVVKVLSNGATSAKTVKKHFDYIGRHGELELETDDEDRVNGDDAGWRLMKDWDLDIEEQRCQSGVAGSRGRAPTRLVHKLVFSMPPGTSPSGVVEAVRNFTREEFALKYRYAFVLHTDEPHPHVHVVVKAMGEDGQRLNIRKATLREWRREFARHLRGQGVAANATDRFVRGETKPRKLDGIYRLHRDPRRNSTHIQERVESVAIALRNGTLQAEPGREALVQTRRSVELGWAAVTDVLVIQGHPKLAAKVGEFVKQMSPPRTEKEFIAAVLLKRASQSPVVRERVQTR